MVMVWIHKVFHGLLCLKTWAQDSFKTKTWGLLKVVGNWKASLVSYSVVQVFLYFLSIEMWVLAAMSSAPPMMHWTVFPCEPEYTLLPLNWFCQVFCHSNKRTSEHTSVIVVSFICGNVNTKKRRRREERWRHKKERNLVEEGLLRNGKGVRVGSGEDKGQVDMIDAVGPAGYHNWLVWTVAVRV